MPWDDLIRTTNKAKARAKIQESTHLDQRCHKEKQPLKINLNSRDDQTDKKAPQAKDKTNPAEQGSKAKKSSEKARKEKKKKGRQGRCKSPNSATGANAAPATATALEG